MASQMRATRDSCPKGKLSGDDADAADDDDEGGGGGEDRFACSNDQSVGATKEPLQPLTTARTSARDVLQVKAADGGTQRGRRCVPREKL